MLKKLRSLTRVSITHGGSADFVVLSDEGYPTNHKASHEEITNWYKESMTKKELVCSLVIRSVLCKLNIHKWYLTGKQNSVQGKQHVCCLCTKYKWATNDQCIP